MKQTSLSIGVSTKRTRWRAFLEERDRAVPWAVLLPRLDIGNVWINLAIVYGLSIPLAFLSHRYFEMPAQRFIWRLARA